MPSTRLLRSIGFSVKTTPSEHFAVSRSLIQSMHAKKRAVLRLSDQSRRPRGRKIVLHYEEPLIEAVGGNVDAEARPQKPEPLGQVELMLLVTGAEDRWNELPLGVLVPSEPGSGDRGETPSSRDPDEVILDRSQKGGHRRVPVALTRAVTGRGE